MKSPFSESEEITTRMNSETESVPASSSESTTGIRSFYFNNERKEVSHESGSMEFTMFHLDISSSRSSSPEEIECLTYNIDKNDKEFKQRIDQIKAEAFNNWLEGKKNLKKKREKEKLLAEQKIKDDREKEEQKLAMAREHKLIEWLNRKKHEKEMKRMEYINNKSDDDNAAKKPATFLFATKADQAKLNFEAWKLKKIEKERIQIEKKEKRIRLEEKMKETQRSLQMEKHRIWLQTAHEKPKPVPLNQGLLSLRGSLYPIYCNPQPWVFNV